MSRTRTAIVATLVVLSLTTALAVGGQTAPSVTADPTPSGPNEADSTHALTMTLPDRTAVVGEQFNDVLVDYSVAQPTADVSNVGSADIERIGIDRGNDLPGTRVDVRVSKIGSVSGKKDGNAIRIALGGNRTLKAGDQLVVVLQSVQNPQNAGTASVNLTVNTQSEASSATGSITYEQHDATARFDDQTSAGETVTVQRVNLSEGGFVAIQNASGSNTDAVRGHSAYLTPGVHEDVQVTLDAPLSADETLVAQAYTDTNADRRFDFVASGGEKDTVYRNTDNNIIGSDDASVTYDESATTTDTATATATDTATATTTDTAPTTDTTTATETRTDATTRTETTTETTPGTTTQTATTTDRTVEPTETETTMTATNDTSEATETTAGGDTDTATPTDGAGPGFGVVSLLAGAALAVLLYRRH